MQTYPEEELIRRLQERDKTAFALLYEQYAVSLYGVIRRIVKEGMVAEEVLQDCFVKIWFSFPCYDRTKGRLFTWLATLSRHLAIDKIRTRSFRKALKTHNLDNMKEGSFGPITSFVPEHIGIRQLTAILSLDHWQVVDLLYFEDYSQAEAVKVLAIPFGTVKTRVRHALQILRKLIKAPPLFAAQNRKGGGAIGAAAFPVN